MAELPESRCTRFLAVADFFKTTAAGLVIPLLEIRAGYFASTKALIFAILAMVINQLLVLEAHR
jgi:hypothetical protein